MQNKNKSANNKLKNKLLSSIKKEVKFLDASLILVFASVVVFTIYISIMTYRTMYEPTALVTAFFAFVGAECGFAASIQKRKMQLKDREYNEYDKTSEQEIDVSQISDNVIDMSDIERLTNTIHDKAQETLTQQESNTEIKIDTAENE